MNPSTACATVLLDELVRGGVAEIVVAPGSRNAPLSFAALAAERRGVIRVHVRIDERSAGFLALGLAAASGAPVAVVCTSGTAVANLHPAVVEADRSGVPLVVVTADRPAELLGVGANQTIEQVGVYGSSVRLSAQIPAGIGKSSNAAWRGRICRVLAAARGIGGGPGPVHLDVAFAAPLTPADDVDARTLYPGRSDGSPWTRVDRPTAAGVTVGLGTGRTLVVIGPGHERLVGSAADAAARAGVQCHVEAGTVIGRPAGTLAAGAWLLGDASYVDRHRPDRLVVVGRPTLGRALGALAARPDVELVVVDDRAEWTDPGHDASKYLCGGDLALDGTADAVWARVWARADALAARVVAETVGSGWSSAAVARAVAAAVDGPLVVGSSNPVRELDLFAPSIAGPVHANRGAAGIDGTVSTALGVALATGKPTVALIGDLTFLHDANGLVLGPVEPRPDLTLVVVNNDGGGIFGLLEQGGPAYAQDFERIFGTPHGVDLAALCLATATPHVRVTSVEQLRLELDRPPGGVRVVEAVVDRLGDRVRRADLAARVAAVLAPS